MSQALDDWRATHMQLIKQALGMHYRQPMFTAGQVSRFADANTLMNMPIDWIAPDTTIQDESGNFHFMADVSPVDGGEPVR